ncbi:MAG: amidohydrolase family protein, partial [Rhodoferax sp.]|nr:amidohydrolase family protein [Rhodoferax sp.]
QQADRAALRQALADGTIDALVSDHSPVDEDSKALPFAQAEPGATGLELLLSLALKWAKDSAIPLPQALATITSGPARILGSAVATPAGRLGTLGTLGTLAPGAVADICVFDPLAYWTVTPAALQSQGKHTPFGGYELPGVVRATLVDGVVSYHFSSV